MLRVHVFLLGQRPMGRSGQAACATPSAASALSGNVCGNLRYTAKFSVSPRNARVYDDFPISQPGFQVQTSRGFVSAATSGSRARPQHQGEE